MGGRLKKVNGGEGRRRLGGDWGKVGEGGY